MRSARTRTRVLGIALAGALALTACGGDDGGGGGGTISVGTIGWTEDVAVNALWGHLMEERGYTWDTSTLEVGSLYAGVANGDLDLFMDAWLPFTHSDYWDQYGDQITDLTMWYDQAPLTWVVPAYVEDVNSIADLQGNADMFGGQIVGIESGSGLMRVSREAVMPDYGLEEGYELVEGSTAAMLAALENAVNDEEPVVVTLWEPHSAYAKWDLKNLEDPEGALGEPDEIHIIASQSFEEDFPEVAEWLGNFSIGSDELADLELKLEEAGEGSQTEAVQAWIEENQDLVDSWFA